MSVESKSSTSFGRVMTFPFPSITTSTTPLHSTFGQTRIPTVDAPLENGALFFNTTCWICKSFGATTVNAPMCIQCGQRILGTCAALTACELLGGNVEIALFCAERNL